MHVEFFPLMECMQNMGALLIALKGEAFSV
jgi:hypothetical protein